MKGFKEFILRGNVVGLAVAFVIGGAFGALVTAFVTDLVTPLIAIPGKTNFADLSFTVGGGVFKYGAFIDAIIAFIGIAAAIYFGLVVPMQKMEERRAAPPIEEDTRACPECLSKIPKAASRCAFCTAQVGPVA